MTRILDFLIGSLIALAFIFFYMSMVLYPESITGSSHSFITHQPRMRGTLSSQFHRFEFDASGVDDLVDVADFDAFFYDDDDDDDDDDEDASHVYDHVTDHDTLAEDGDDQTDDDDDDDDIYLEGIGFEPFGLHTVEEQYLD